MTLMRTFNPAKLLTATAIGAIAVAASPALAQNAAAPPEQETRDADVIVVTGITKQDADIQDTPIAITAFSGEDLVNSGVEDVGDISSFTPGFNVKGAGNNPTALILSMRGQVQNDNIASLEPSVGVYLDEMYVARSYGMNTNLIDIESVQVLKGPQGTLFGRNTSAGALLIQTADPRFDELSGKVSATYGRFDQLEGSAILNVGIGENIAVRGAFWYGERGNYQYDSFRNVGYGERQEINGRIKLSANITPNLNLLLSGEWFDSEIKGPARKNSLFFLPGTGDVAAAFRTASGSDVDSVGVTPLSLFPQAPDSLLKGRRSDLFNDITTKTFIGKLTLDTFFGQVKFIGGYRNVTGLNLIDLDGAPFPGHYTSGQQDLTQYSGELQVTGSTATGFIDFAAGLTYFHEYGFDISRSATVQNTSVFSGFNGMIDNDSYGMYAQASINASDRLRFNVGGRYSIDDKGITAQSAVYPLNGQTPAVCLPQTLNIGIVLSGGTLTPSDCNRPRRDSFKNFSYTVGVDFDLTDDVLVYAKQSTGYRSGAQQLRTLTFTDTAPALPEKVNEQEIGVKASFGPATINVAGFHNKVKGAQRSVILAIAGQSQTVLENADTEAWGVEADANFEITRGFNVFATGSLLDVKYTRYDGFVTAAGVLTPVDKSNYRYVGTATEQFTVGADYRGDLGAATLGLNVAYSWTGEIAQDGADAAVFLGNGIPANLVDDYLAATVSPSIGLLNARASVAFGPNENFEVAVWGKNILDERTPLYTLYLGGLNYVGSYYNDPATYGITGTVRF